MSLSKCESLQKALIIPLLNYLVPQTLWLDSLNSTQFIIDGMNQREPHGQFPPELLSRQEFFNRKLLEGAWTLSKLEHLSLSISYLE